MNGKRSCLSLSIFLFLTSLTFAGEAPYNPNPGPRYIYCTLQDVPQRSVYYSGIFLINSKDNLYPIQDAFLHFAASKYSYTIQPGVDQYHMPVNCRGTQDSKAEKTMKVADMQNQQGTGYKTIDTKWTFGSQKVAEEEIASASSDGPASSGGSASMTMLPGAAQDDKLDSFTMATLQQDPRGMRLSPLDRQFVLSEAPKAKSYCAKDPELSVKYDCTCFVTTLFSYRITHAAGPIQTTNFPPLAAVLKNEDFKLTACQKAKQ